MEVVGDLLFRKVKGTGKNLEKNGYMYKCSWFTLWYSGNCHNIVSQLYFNKI